MGVNNAAAYLAQLQQLLPYGAAWPREPSATLTGLLSAIADELARVEADAWRLFDEADPNTSAELLADWERVMGLPDACLGTPGTVAERRQAIVGRLTASGNQSSQFYIDLAAGAGYTITIVETLTHTWEVHSPATTVQVLTCVGPCDEPLRTWGNQILECLINYYKPAHSVVTFVYAASTSSTVVPFGPGETYLTLSAALVATAFGQPGAISPVADNVNLVFEATSAFADTAPATISRNDYWTDPTHTVTVRAAVGARHNGAPGTGYRLSAAGNTTPGAKLLVVDGDAHVTIQGIEVDGLGSTGGGSVAACVATSDVAGNGAPLAFSIDGCLIHSSDVDGIAPVPGGVLTSNITIANSVISDNAGFGLHMPIGNAASEMVRMVGCTLAANGTAITTDGNGGNVEMVGCLSANNTTEIFNGLFTAASDWNTGTGIFAPGANSQTGVAVAFTNAPVGDYSLTPGDYAPLTAKPSAATVAAAVAGWPGSINTGLDVKASPRVDPLTPGAYVGGP